MTKEQADKIAKQFVHWVIAAQSSDDSSQWDIPVINKISAALVDASKVTEVIDQKVDDINQSVVLTECAEFEEWISKNVSFRDGTEPIWIKNQAHYAPTKALFEQLWNVAYLSGQKSKALKLPERKDVTGKVNYEVWANVGWNNCIDEIKSLNEGK